MIKTHFFGTDCIIDKSLQDRRNLKNNLQKINFEYNNLLMLNQVHGKDVVLIDHVDKIYDDQNLPKADGIVCNIKNVAIAIVTADCSPILMWDEERQIIAAVHAGWRGAKAGVIGEAVKLMRNMGTKIIKAKIGPMIQQYSYEVAQDFYDEFMEEDKKNKKFFFDNKQLQKLFFDLPAYVEEKLIDSDVVSINNCRTDTYSSLSSFFSYRRSTHLGEANCGRNISIIVNSDIS